VGSRNLTNEEPIARVGLHQHKQKKLLYLLSCRGFAVHITSSISDQVAYLNFLKSRSFFTYHQVQNLKIIHGARLALIVLFVSRNGERLLFYKSLTNCFL
jgi:hypothetical protein